MNIFNPICGENRMYDLLIVGSGPAGLSAAIYAKRANMNVAVVEKEYMGTGQIAESQRVDNYPGYYGISGFDLGEKFREHVSKLEIEFIDGCVVEVNKKKSDNDEAYFELVMQNDGSLLSKTIIYATGASPKRTFVKGEENLLGKGVSFCALCDGAFYKDSKVAVLGGGDTALDDALYLSDICSQVYLIHRRDEFRGAKSTVSLLEQRDNVSFLLNEELAEIRGKEEVQGILLKSGKELEVTGVFVAFGSTPNSSVIKNLVKTDEAGYVIAAEDGRTNCQGLFVAGDIRTKSLRQVVTAVADGAYTLTSVQEYLKNSK